MSPDSKRVYKFSRRDLFRFGLYGAGAAFSLTPLGKALAQGQTETDNKFRISGTGNPYLVHPTEEVKAMLESKDPPGLNTTGVARTLADKREPGLDTEDKIKACADQIAADDRNRQFVTPDGKFRPKYASVSTVQISPKFEPACYPEQQAVAYSKPPSDSVNSVPVVPAALSVSESPVSSSQSSASLLEGLNAELAKYAGTLECLKSLGFVGAGLLAFKFLFGLLDGASTPGIESSYAKQSSAGPSKMEQLVALARPNYDASKFEDDPEQVALGRRNDEQKKRLRDNTRALLDMYEGIPEEILKWVPMIMGGTDPVFTNYKKTFRLKGDTSGPYTRKDVMGDLGDLGDDDEDFGGLFTPRSKGPTKGQDTPSRSNWRESPKKELPPPAPRQIAAPPKQLSAGRVVEGSYKRKD